MRILFLGAGAVGGYFGGRLVQAGADVTFLVRERRAAEVSGGLKIVSPNGDATIPVKTVLAGDPADPFDIVILTPKAYGLDGALDAIEPHVGAGTVVMPLLNGLAHLAKIEARFPTATVWAGVAQIPAELTPDGTVLHKGTLAGMVVGPRDGQEATRPLAEALVAKLQDAGITARFTETPVQDLWNKWVFLCTLAASGCLFRGHVGEILATDHGRDILAALLGECSAVAESEGFRPPDAQMENYAKMLSDPASKWSPSMLHDLRSGKPTEADHIIGEMIRLGRGHGLETPYLKVALSHLQVYEATRA
ncbi:MAG: ketopantoate reductase family protein [Pseudomonadota bacterium]